MTWQEVRFCAAWLPATALTGAARVLIRVGDPFVIGAVALVMLDLSDLLLAWYQGGERMPVPCETWADHDFAHELKRTTTGRHPVKGPFVRREKHCRRCGRVLVETEWLREQSNREESLR